MTTDALQSVADLEGVVAATKKAQLAIAAVHRRPVNLRKTEITSGEAVMRGARVSSWLSPGIPEENCIDVYSLLAPDSVDRTCQIFLRAPLQIMAKVDVLVGGAGRPAPEKANALIHLSEVVPKAATSPLLASWIHWQLLMLNPFEQRSGVVARSVARIAATASGFDPRCLTVPESYWHRHRAKYGELCSGEAYVEKLRQFVLFDLAAWEAGAIEAESIARAAG